MTDSVRSEVRAKARTLGSNMLPPLSACRLRPVHEVFSIKPYLMIQMIQKKVAPIDNLLSIIFWNWRNLRNCCLREIVRGYALPLLSSMERYLRKTRQATQIEHNHHFDDGLALRP